jgi:hypothetical protein
MKPTSKRSLSAVIPGGSWMRQDAAEVLDDAYAVESTTPLCHGCGAEAEPDRNFCSACWMEFGGGYL